jgi:hypothetical protein
MLTQRRLEKERQKQRHRQFTVRSIEREDCQRSKPNTPRYRDLTVASTTMS